MVWTILTLFLVVGIGFFAKSINLVKENDTELLKKIVLNITLPTAIALSFINTSLEWNHARLIYVGILGTLLAIAIYIAIFKVIFKKDNIFPTAVILAYFSNAGFLGLPIMLSMFGKEGLSLALPYQVSSHSPLLLFTIGALVLAYFGKSNKKKKGSRSLASALINPIVLAAPVGIILHFFWIPEFIMEVMDITALANTFLIMFVVGLMLDPKKISTKFVWPTVIIVSCTLLLTPAIIYLVGISIGLQGLSLQVSTLESAMPCAVLNLLLIKEYKMNVELGETVFFVSTVLSVVSLPVVNHVFF